jgi:hypothetical protein
MVPAVDDEINHRDEEDSDYDRDAESSDDCAGERSVLLAAPSMPRAMESIPSNLAREVIRIGRKRNFRVTDHPSARIGYFEFIGVSF